jgi:AraC-like DNA-binding protein
VLKDEVRHTRAEELLSRTSKPIKQIALVLGFSSEKTFARAFLRWSGVLPSVFRDQARGGTALPQPGQMP